MAVVTKRLRFVTSVPTNVARALVEGLEHDFIAVVRFQGPRANGMPELHKLTPPLAVLQGQGLRDAGGVPEREERLAVSRADPAGLQGLHGTVGEPEQAEGVGHGGAILPDPGGHDLLGEATTARAS